MKSGSTRFRKTVGGLAFLEIMLSLFILAFAMIPIAGLMGQGFKGTRQDQRQIRAVQLCQGRLNMALKLPYWQVNTSAASIASGGVVVLPLGLATIEGIDYQVQVQTANHPLSFPSRPVDLNAAGYDPTNPATYIFLSEEALAIPNNGAKQVAMIVTWNEPNGVARSVQISSFLANFDL